MSAYLRRLRNHPGVPVACALTVLGGIAGGFGGGAIMSVFWLPVLLTNRRPP